MTAGSDATQLRAVVFGATGGIGYALTDELSQRDLFATVYACRRDERQPLPQSAKVVPVGVDLEDEESIKDAAASIGDAGPVDLILVATGMLHDLPQYRPEKSWEEIDATQLARAFAVNCTGPALIARYFLPLLPKERRGVFAALSARVGSIQDNRLGGWYSYRASKAALNMLIRTLAIELARRSPQAICIGLHPGTVDTGLSKPFQARVPEKQLFTPEQAAEKLLDVIAGLEPDDSGGLFAYDGERIPY